MIKTYKCPNCGAPFTPIKGIRPCDYYGTYLECEKTADNIITLPYGNLSGEEFTLYFNT